jgi:Spy/CpxP family protein refolding chaperone
MTALLALFVVALAFIAGGVVGFAADRFMLRRGFAHGGPPQFSTRSIVRHLDRELDLTPDQKAKVEEIVKRRHEHIDSVWTNIHAQIRTEIDGANAEIEKILTPEQRVKFDRMKMRMRSRSRLGGGD